MAAEDIHQSRVAARRASAALEAFRALLPRKRRRRILKMVRQIRRAAGQVRDDDVLLQRWSEWLAAGELPAAVAPLLDELRQQRRERMSPVKDVYRRCRRQDFPQQIDEIADRIKWRKRGAEPSYRAFAAAVFLELYEELRRAELAAHQTIEDLHQLRILGKHVRYSLELFAAAYPERKLRRELYLPIAECQDLLGRVNDHATALARLEAWRCAESGAAVRSALIDRESAALSEAQTEFALWRRGGAAQHIADQLRQLGEP